MNENKDDQKFFELVKNDADFQITKRSGKKMLENEVLKNLTKVWNDKPCPKT